MEYKYRKGPPNPKRPNVQVGDTVVRELSVCAGLGGADKFRRGTVVYVHPKGRFHVVEFALPGGAYRESFWGTSVKPLSIQ